MNPRLYEINTAVWLYELSQRYGAPVTIGNIPSDQWDSLGRLGFDYLWLMGLWKRSKAGPEIFRKDPEYKAFADHLDTIVPGWTEEDVPGSPYSIAAYEPDPLLGTWEDLDRAREEMRRRGMGLILDFVPNHTAPDHPWVSEHPEFYLQGSEEDYAGNPRLFTRITHRGKPLAIARGKDPYFPPWTDTVQLNYFSPETRTALIAELRRIAMHCDGVRCDMAMLVLNDIFRENWKWLRRNYHSGPAQEFWAEVRAAFPDLLLMAEAYWNTEWQLQQLGFDYVYDKALYDRLLHASPQEVLHHLEGDIEYQKKLVRFIENHDEPRSAAVFGAPKAKAAAVLFSTLPGMRLYYQGQLEGKKIKIPVQVRRVKEERPDEELGRLYERLIAVTGEAVYSQGNWKLLNVLSSGDGSYHNLISCIWRLQDQRQIIVVNLSEEYSQGIIPMHNELPHDRDYALYDELSSRLFHRKGDDLVNRGLHVILEGYQSHILTFTC